MTKRIEGFLAEVDRALDNAAISEQSAFEKPLHRDLIPINKIEI